MGRKIYWDNFFCFAWCVCLKTYSLAHFNEPVNIYKVLQIECTIPISRHLKGVAAFSLYLLVVPTHKIPILFFDISTKRAYLEQTWDVKICGFCLFGIEGSGFSLSMCSTTLLLPVMCCHPTTIPGQERYMADRFLKFFCHVITSPSALQNPSSIVLSTSN